MSLKIDRFEIKGLYGARDYDIPIRDNKIVMVGVNGLGKTTVVNLLYLILSRQWDRSLEYDCDSIAISVDGIKYTCTQTRGETPAPIQKRLRSIMRRVLSSTPF